MNYIIDILKGTAIGISNIIPGFSGGTMAVILGVYERLIGSICDITKKPLIVIKDLWAMLIGVIIGVVIASFGVVYLIKEFPLQTIMLFVGMIIGTIPNIYFNIKNLSLREDKKLDLSLLDIITFIICFLIMIILPLINSNILIDELNVFVFMFIFIMGIICASAMMIPGISGSLVLMVFGIYLLILENINNFISMVISFNFENIISPFLVLFIFGLGVLVGIFSISKIIKKQFEKRRRTVYCAIFGLLISSVFSIIYATVGEYNEVINWKDPFVYIISVLMFILGSTIVCTLEKMEKNKETN